MTTYQPIIPPGEWFSPLQTGERRVRSAVLGDLLQLPDTSLVSPTVVVTRQDGATITNQDLQAIGSPVLDGRGLIVSITLGNGQLPGVGYYITFAANGNISGNPYIRTVSMSVLAVVG